MLRRHRTTVASWTALTVVSGLLVAYAVTADGYPTHRAELNDGGIWVTNQAMGAVGRQNVPVAQIDARVFDGSSEKRLPDLDVLQDGSAVFSVDRANGSLMPIDVSMGAGLQDQRVLGGGSSAVFGGGSLGVLDPATGKLWATVADPETGTSSLTDVSRDAKPLVTVGDGAVVAAGPDGTLYAASSEKGELVTLQRVAASSGFGKPDRSPLDVEAEGGFAAMTVVGDVPVVADAKGNLLTASGSLASVGDGAVLQQAGPQRDEVLVATPDSLVAVAVTDGTTRTVAEVAGGGEPAAPVVMANGCAFAAWGEGGQGTLVTACGEGEAVVNPFAIQPGAQLVFRVNRNQVVLNDETSGMAWTVADAEPEKISDWDAFRQEPQRKKDADDHKTEAETSQPPQAEPDELGARDGRTTVLHVLDNDRIATDGILSIVEVTEANQDGVDVRIAPDRQSLLATVSPGARGTAKFRYRIDDGTEGKTSQDEGEVTLHLRSDPGSGKPVLRDNAKVRTFPVTAGGVVEFAVTPDWRDPAYGDPVVVDSAKGTGDLRVSTTALGLVRVEAPAGSKGGVSRISYEVSTGQGSVEATVPVEVVPAGTRTLPAQAEPDVVSGEADAPIVVRPLDNDIPGADGSEPGATLVLAGQVAPTGGLEVDTDLESGRLVVRGATPGSYLLDYNAGFGAAKRSPGQIRVDISPASKDSDTPVATPDNANVHGQAPMIVDVLANDYDPKGRLLVVQNARPSSDDTQLEVAVVDGRWIRVNATDPAIAPASQSVTYTVSNGVNEATGSISVTQHEALTGAANMPVTQVDRVTVRAGDTASIPVLDNDSTPSGDPVALVLDADASYVGEYRVLPKGSGTAYVSGRRVRFVAPEGLRGAVDAEVQYVVENTGDPTAPTAVGLVKVHVTAPPSTTNPNQAPTPRALEGRVVQGEKVTLALPPVGSDPDGDSVAVTGIETPPKYGRILSFGANSLTYQAYPDSEGTDEFRYTVTDRWGKTASASVRVGVVRPGDPQAPLALDDSLFAEPGREVDVDVLANDLRGPGTQVRILPLEAVGPGVGLRSETGPITVAAPEHNRTTRVVYTITNGIDESRGVLTVNGRDPFNNPPVVEDIYATPKAGATSVEVDVVGATYDVDGPESELELVDVTGDRLSAVGGTGEAGTDAETTEAGQVRIEAGKVVVPVTGIAQVLAYRVSDAEGGVAAAAIYVPARPSGAPYLKPGAEITLDPRTSVTADLEDLVIDPEGDPVRLTTDDTIAASPETRLAVTAVDTASLEVTASEGEGPGAVMFEVADRTDLGDASAHRTYISVPVTVGEPAPKITCPTDAVEVPEGGISRTIDIATICHVWTADAADADDLEFIVDWARDGEIPGVTLESVDGSGVRFEASAQVQRGAAGLVRVGVKGHETTSSLRVVVVEQPAPRLAPIRLDTQAGKAVSVDVAPYVTSPIPSEKRDITVLSATPVGGAAAAVSTAGSKVTFTPKKGFDGAMRFRLEVSDVGPEPGARSTAVGDVQLAVVDRPDAPADLRIGSEILANTVALTWTTPDNNGERIDRYEVAWNGGTFSCPGSPCRVTGLDNGKPYAFSVKAHNAAGWSDASNKVTGEPDAFTGPVRNPRILLQRNGEITVAWDPPASCDCSKVQEYQVSAPGMGIRRIPAGVTQTKVPAVNGERVTITIVPLNAKGIKENDGPPNSVTGTAAGAPAAPARPRLSSSNVAGGSQKSVTVAWSPVGANGPGPVKYEVSRGGRVVCAWTTATSCQDAGIANDGTTYTYTVRAKNGEADSQREATAGGAAYHISPQSPGSSIEASAQPAAPVINSITPTGKDGQAKIAFTAGASHGRSNTVTCTVGRCSWSGSRSGGSGTMLVTGLRNGDATRVALKACNGSSNPALACKTGSPRTVTTYGPLGAVTLRVWQSGQQLYYRASANPNGKPVTFEITRRMGLGTGGIVVDSGTSGTKAFTREVGWTASADRWYTFYFHVRAGARGNRTVKQEFKTAAMPKELYAYDHTSCRAGTSGCARTELCVRLCWKLRINSQNFPTQTRCQLHRPSTGAAFGPSWTQPKGSGNTYTSFAIEDYTSYYVQCDNGTRTQNLGAGRSTRT